MDEVNFVRLAINPLKRSVRCEIRPRTRPSFVGKGPISSKIVSGTDSEMAKWY